MLTSASTTTAAASSASCTTTGCCTGAETLVAVPLINFCKRSIAELRNGSSAGEEFEDRNPGSGGEQIAIPSLVVPLPLSLLLSLMLMLLPFGSLPGLLLDISVTEEFEQEEMF